MKENRIKNMMGVAIVTAILLPFSGFGQSGWYTEGNFEPAQRMKITIHNPLDIDRYDCPVVITHEEFPVKKLHEMWVTVVDPQLPSKPAPTQEELAFVGGHGILEETNGHQIFYQLDDLNKDGIWDELFFQTDLKANESKTIYIYFGFSGRGWNPLGTYATIGSYCRHIIPWWESENIGWKLWFPTSVDMYGKRQPHLISQHMCIGNYCGYSGIPRINPEWGSDIQTVSNSFGAGGIGLFELEEWPDSVSVPRFTPREAMKISEANFNEDQITDTRYAFDVVVNGPLRSTIRVKTMNWDSGNGYYELTQDYTAYTRQSYSTCKVTFTQFFPHQNGVVFACGIRADKDEQANKVEKGIALRLGTEEAASPDDKLALSRYTIDFVGSALVVKDIYNPTYSRISSLSGNHIFKIPVTEDKRFEYLIAGAWSEGAVYNTPELFTEYVRKTALEYNYPPKLEFGKLEKK
jgi:hypothetical protein